MVQYAMMCSGDLQDDNSITMKKYKKQLEVNIENNSTDILAEMNWEGGTEEIKEAKKEENMKTIDDLESTSDADHFDQSLDFNSQFLHSLQCF